ncbi:PDC sensor domain-containing protein [Enterovibrio nigricans]|uniref:Cache domain-containing protein n=1 Tax=Enterovibrio nigricans DSM 22720 TaxID=1121868 RepID=A0A1T4VBI7_9GAMM|nr:hypothetical protein [Enterovibrio nigricans]SKA62315.1 hypothetical protein SAMN02745132_03603 [Enterovibrio nigricans DSM 22720]
MKTISRLDKLHGQNLIWFSSLIWLLFCVAAFIKFSWQEEVDTKIRRYIVSETMDASRLVNSNLNKLTESVNTISKLATHSRGDHKHLKQMIKNTVINTPGVVHGGVIFTNTDSAETQIIYENGSKQKSEISLDRVRIPIDRITQAQWLPPYFDPVAKAWFSKYVFPFTNIQPSEGETDNQGIVYLDFSLESLSQQMLNFKLGAKGFAFLISNTGQILAYPKNSALGLDISFFEADEEPLLSTIASQLHLGTLGSFKHPVTEREHWIVLEDIDHLNAKLGLVIEADELRHSLSPSYEYWDIIWFIVLAGIISLLASLNFPKDNKAKTRRLFTALSLCLFSYLLLLWFQALAPKLLSKGETLLVDHDSASLAVIEKTQHQEIFNKKQSMPIKLTIQTLTLEDADQVNIIGKVVTEDTGDTGDTGEKIPPLIINNASECRWTLISSLPNRLLLWQFVAVVKQPFDYGSFPFDREVIELSMVPSPSLNKEFLIPSFSSYASMRSESLPGIAMAEPKFGNWKILQSYFSYLNETVTEDDTLTNLKYNIVIQRNITGPLISHIMPLLVISFLTYFMLLLWTKDEKQQALWGFSTATVLQYCASLFFILVIAHVALREELNAQGVIFIEYFYFLVYFQIIFTAIGALAFTTELKIPVLENEQGLKIKQWYWPILLFLSLAITYVFIDH